MIGTVTKVTTVAPLLIPIPDVFFLIATIVYRKILVGYHKNQLNFFEKVYF